MSRKTSTRKAPRTNLSVLSRLCNLIPGFFTGFLAPKLASQFGVDERALACAPWSPLVALLYARLAHALSLNDVRDGLRQHAAIALVPERADRIEWEAGESRMMARKTCPRCGEKLAGDETECSFCWLELESASEAPAPSTGGADEGASGDRTAEMEEAIASDAEYQRTRRERRRMRRTAWEATRRRNQAGWRLYLREGRALAQEAWSILAVRVTVAIVCVALATVLTVHLVLAAADGSLSAMEGALDRIRDALRTLFD